MICTAAASQTARFASGCCDHPDVRAERDYRRAATHQYEREQAAAVRAWADKISAHPDPPQTARNLADSIEPRADESALRSEVEFAEPDDVYVRRLSADFETYMQVSGPPDTYDYRYPSI